MLNRKIRLNPTTKKQRKDQAFITTTYYLDNGRLTGN
jgi:hypothetical protein